MKTGDFLDACGRQGIRFITGVPDSLLKDFVYALDRRDGVKHIVSTNEGSALGLAIGHHLATGEVPLVYLQNSGLGNLVNPLLSLADQEVYGIPVVLLVGWRGEPGVKDEPQHIKQGRVTLPLLKAMEIPCFMMESDSDPVELVDKAARTSLANCAPVAIVCRKGALEPVTTTTNVVNESYPTREEVITHVADQLDERHLIVSTTGMASRELFEHRRARNSGHSRDFLTVGGMGHASQIALGVAMSTDRPVACLDGDGALLMHLGSAAIIGDQQPVNYFHIVLNNGAHDSVGGQPTVAHQIDVPAIARALNYATALQCTTLDEITDALSSCSGHAGPHLIEVLTRKGNRADLGRPDATPHDNKVALMAEIAEGS